MTHFQEGNLRIAADVVLGQRVKLVDFVNLYGCEIGDDTRIGTFVEVQRGARIGARCKISSHTFICEGVRIEDEVFIGHGVMFVNDRYPRAANGDGAPKTADGVAAASGSLSVRLNSRIRVNSAPCAPAGVKALA